MLQNTCQLRGQGIQAVDRNTQFAVVDRSSPCRGASDVEEGLLGVEGYENIVAGWAAEVADEIVKVRLQSGDDLPTEGFRSLLALIVQNEVTALPLGELRFDILLALRFGQELLDFSIGAQRKGSPRQNRWPRRASRPRAA